jgi:hypothetical protein
MPPLPELLSTRVSKTLDQIRAELFGHIEAVQNEYAAKGWLPVRLNLNKGVVRGILELVCWGLWQLATGQTDGISGSPGPQQGCAYAADAADAGDQMRPVRPSPRQRRSGQPGHQVPALRDDQSHHQERPERQTLEGREPLYGGSHA